MRLAAFRRRLLFRGVFLLLAFATIALAVVLLQDEKARSYGNYEQDFRRRQADVLVKLRQPTGLLALLNPSMPEDSTPLRPLVLPYPALDFDDPNKAQQAVDAAGCAVRYADGSSLCAGVGSSPIAGGYLYLVGSFRAGDLVVHENGALDLEAVHRARIVVEMRGELKSWVAPFERFSMRGEPLVRARIAAFETTGDPSLANARPVREFRGWLWQSATCSAGGELPECPRTVFYAMRLPLDALREAPAESPRRAWPPPDLNLARVHLRILAPGDGPLLFDSNAPTGTRGPASLEALGRDLLPGETIAIRRQDSREAARVLKGDDAGEGGSPALLRLIDRLPTGRPAPAVEARETIQAPVGTWEAAFTGNARGIDRSLGAVATRMSWYVGAMLLAIAAAWLVIELGLIRRITELSRRAAAVSRGVQGGAGAQGMARLDVSDLRGADELGLLAGGLADLLQRVKDDVQREQLRARQERDMLQAVGHEILSPLQSLMVLHPDADDPARRYVQRMQQAIRVLYGHASPSEALEAAQLELSRLDLDAFLRQVAQNAHHAGIAEVRYDQAAAPVVVRADEFSLEDVVTHILRNAQHHRRPGTPITVSLEAGATQAVVRIHNEGPAIEPSLLESIFDYGVREAASPVAGERRGQGLFVARTYLLKMGGSIAARNEDGGVAFVLTLPRLA
jgi:two-component system OmpR family sensor kinase